MADQKEDLQLDDLPPGHVEEEQDEPFWENDSLSVPEFYVNAARMDEGAADVTIVMGTYYKDGGEVRRACKLRLVMTQYDFVTFAKRAAIEARFIERAFQRSGLVSIVGVPQEDYDAAVDDYSSALDKLPG